jgi:hypothetical protein
MRYELTGKPRLHTPVRAYTRARVAWLLRRRDRSDCGVEFTADVGLDPKLGEAIVPELRWHEVGGGCG